MIVLGSWGDSMQFEKPTGFVVSRVARGSESLLRQYALGESIDESGASRPVAVTLRSRARWHAPRGGKECEALIWSLDGAEALEGPGNFDVPAVGASIGWVKDTELQAELRTWRARTGVARHA